MPALNLGGLVARDAGVFVGKIAIITGGASGIGKALGTELFLLGAHVVLADVDGSDAESVAHEQTAHASTDTGSVVGAQLDVRNASEFQAVVDETIERHGRLDLLFNNAGISMGGETHDMDIAHWDRIIDVNIRGVVNGVQAAYPRMIAQGQGHIVNTASGAGLAPAPLTVAYTTTKYAVVGLSTCLRPEAAVHGVRVSVLCPGPVDTPILDRGPPSDLPARRRADDRSGVPREAWVLSDAGRSVRTARSARSRPQQSDHRRASARQSALVRAARLSCTDAEHRSVHGSPCPQGPRRDDPGARGQVVPIRALTAASTVRPSAAPPTTSSGRCAPM